MSFSFLTRPVHTQILFNEWWLVVDLSLWKVWLRQLGWWTSQLNGKIKVMFQSPPTRLVIIEHRLSIYYPLIIHILSIYYPNHQPEWFWKFQFSATSWCLLKWAIPCLVGASHFKTVQFHVSGPLKMSLHNLSMYCTILCIYIYIYIYI